MLKWGTYYDQIQVAAVMKIVDEKLHQEEATHPLRDTERQSLKQECVVAGTGNTGDVK